MGARAARMAGLALGAVLGAGAANSAACLPGRALILSADGRSTGFGVEIADDPQERAQGLMNRRDLPRGQGMLFIYDSAQPVNFWMKDTLIPLDMLFFDARGVLRHVHAGARPLDLTPVPGAVPGDPQPDRLLVLEIAGGEAARLDLAPGARLAHPAVPQATAAAPCD
ncbi:MAG TPA: DUF192 domain-containing protein [Paracoccus sp. (in: a-proteobacteria)]|nr:DUF192 domain-containing protein [Paracoccus sp. (in: a-proteobacteria)]